MAATPKTITDNSSDLDEANLNLFVRGGKLQVKVNYFMLLFTDSSNAVTVDATQDSDGEVVSADLVWNVGSTRVDITLSGFSIAPIGFTTIRGNSSTNVEKTWMDFSSVTLATMSFRSSATPGIKVNPDGDMTIAVQFIGA